jgi:hypothetical protein
VIKQEKASTLFDDGVTKQGNAFNYLVRTTTANSAWFEGLAVCVRAGVSLNQRKRNCYSGCATRNTIVYISLQNLREEDSEYFQR